MSYDTDAIKAKVSIAALFTRDGHVLKRKGGGIFANCPFHEERSASCHVVPEKGTFKCFGCGAGGDIFEYWQLSRSCVFVEAGRALAELAGVGFVEGDEYVKPVRCIEEKAPEIPAPMIGEDLERWCEGCAFLAENTEEQFKIAEWRGYTVETVKRLAAAGKIGLPRHRGARRVAFAVEAVDANGRMFLAGYHARVPSRSKENDWLFVYEPKGIGAWPFVLGDPSTARVLVILEGQWDAIAFADATGYLGLDGKKICVMGIRGASSWRKALAHKWEERDTQIFLWSDADEAGVAWHAPENFASFLLPRTRALHGLSWKGCKDFNDAHRRGITNREGWKGALLKLLLTLWHRGLRKRRRRKKKPELAEVKR